MSFRKVYSGSRRKLVIAFDVGTTFSGASYAILDPKEVPEIKAVVRFPGASGDSKIPTIIYYDKMGVVQAAGAEAAVAEDDGMTDDWTKAEWFKLHLRPKYKSKKGVEKLPPLPGKKSAIDVFSDFLRYLHQCTIKYIEQSHANGATLLEQVKDNTEFVLTHPNGWEGAQQMMMRQATIQAGLIRDNDEGHRRVLFVTEGEASLHFCVDYAGLMTEAMRLGGGVLVVDAGGGTVDISAYARTSSSQASTPELEEIAASQCHFQGSVFVTKRAETHIKSVLTGSKYSKDEYFEPIRKTFDTATKLRFKNSNTDQFIKFGTTSDNDKCHNIKRGILALKGSDVAKCFEPSIDCIVNAAYGMISEAKKPILSIYLVGGFAASDWLFEQVRERLKPHGVDFCRPEQNVNKAVAHGAVAFYLDRFVRSRVSKFSYGVHAAYPYVATDPEHQARLANKITNASGKTYISDGYAEILPKNIQATETREFRHAFCISAHHHYELHIIRATLYAYRGEKASPKWLNVDPDRFSALCTIEADMSKFASTLKSTWGKGEKAGTKHYTILFDIVYYFGATELQAEIRWEENGVEKRSPAKVVYPPED